MRYTNIVIRFDKMFPKKFLCILIVTILLAIGVYGVYNMIMNPMLIVDFLIFLGMILIIELIFALISYLRQKLKNQRNNIYQS